MKKVAFIPSRYGSTRFPGKPLSIISGKPMIRHVYERAITCKGLDGVYVATDDERIRDCVEGFGGRVVMTAGRHPSGTDRIREAAESIGLSDEDVVVNIQGDQPAFNPLCVDLLIRGLLEETEAPMATLIYRPRDEAWVRQPEDVKVVTDMSGYAIYFSRAGIPYYREAGDERVYNKHLGFYVFRMAFLRIFNSLPQGLLEQAEKLEQLRALEYGYKIKVLQSPWDSPEVDIPSDIREMERIISQCPY
jgi:3-deoxy-manno-octulosonate cytidylyltransferase (CMP-KDO synthetase)